MPGSRRRRWVVLGLIGLAGIACAAVGSGRRATSGVQDPTEMRRIILEAAPVGSATDAARRFLEREGFRGTDWPKVVAGAGPGPAEGTDRLWFWGRDGSIVQRVWNVAVDYREGRVTDIHASTPGLVGP